jgi:hypothetical protein
MKKSTLKTTERVGLTISTMGLFLFALRLLYNVIEKNPWDENVTFSTTILVIGVLIIGFVAWYNILFKKHVIIEKGKINTLMCQIVFTAVDSSMKVHRLYTSEFCAPEHEWMEALLQYIEVKKLEIETQFKKEFSHEVTMLHKNF